MISAAPSPHRDRRGHRRKGLEKGCRRQANILVVLHGATETKRNASTFYSGMGGSAMGTAALAAAWGRHRQWCTNTSVGMLIVDMFDAKTKNLVFRGTAEDELSDNPDKNKKRLEKASTKDVQELSTRRENEVGNAPRGFRQALLKLVGEVRTDGQRTREDGSGGGTARREHDRMRDSLAPSAADPDHGTGGDRVPGRSRPRASISKAAGSSSRSSSIHPDANRSR